jgi:hypothetical protein
MFWHAGFPAMVIVYAFLGTPAARSLHARIVDGDSTRVILDCTGAALVVVCALTLLAAHGESYLPTLLARDRFTDGGEAWSGASGSCASPRWRSSGGAARAPRSTSGSWS